MFNPRVTAVTMPPTASGEWRMMRPANSRAAGIGEASTLARQIVLLLDGSFAVVLLHRDPSYMETAGKAAYSLTQAALMERPVSAKRRGRQVRG
jgi:hypothetical protein